MPSCTLDFARRKGSSPRTVRLFDHKSRIRPFWCLVKGIEELHREGTYYRRAKRDGKWKWESLGEKLQCVSRSSAERFMDEGITTIAELAWSDPVDLTLRTNKEFDYVIDCASQALVWVYFEEKTRDLYKLSLRTAHEVTSLVYSLNSTNSGNAAQAKETLVEAAKNTGSRD